MTIKFIFILLTVFFSGCNQDNSFDTKPNLMTDTNSSDSEIIADQRQNLAVWQDIVLSKANLKDWQVEAEDLGTDNLTDVFFVDSNNGWIVSQNGDVFDAKGGILYKTIDAGKTWTKINLSIPKSFFISKVFFITEEIGWLLIQTDGNADKAVRTVLNIMVTDDGGLHWKLQNHFDDAYASKLMVSRNGEGWLTGFTRKSNDSVAGIGLILHTRDFGNTWSDVSPTHSNATEDGREAFTATVNRWNDIYSDQEFTATALSDNGKILKTTDGGASWQLVNKIPYDPIGYAKISSDNFSLLKRFKASDFLVLSGRNSQEGTLTNFMLVDKNRVYERYRLPNVYISDIAYVRSNEIIACGTKLQLNHQKNLINRNGIILYSKDMTNWEIIYETTNQCKRGCSFNKISVFNKTLVVVGSDAKLIKFIKTLN